MSEPHVVFVYGPFAFVAISCVASVLLRPAVQRALTARRERRFDRRLSHLGTIARDLTGARGRRISVVGVIEVDDDDDPTGLAFEQATGAEGGRIVGRRPTIRVGAERVGVVGELSVLVGSDEVTIEGTRFRRLYRGDRVHVTGKLVELAESSRSSDEDRPEGGEEGDDTGAHAPKMALAAEPLAPVQLVEANLPPESRPFVARSMSLLLTIGLFWGLSALLARGLIALPASPTGPLPGSRVDGDVIAHAVPPMSNLAARALVDRIEARPYERWTDRAELEDAMVLAARLDPDPDRAVARFLRRSMRTRAGWFSLRHPSPSSCPAGMAALSEAARGGQLQELMAACSHLPGDAPGKAAFAMGDFMNAVGPEAESIISRVTLPPDGEPDCVAGGYDVPPASLPLCRLEHAEQVKAARTQIYAELDDRTLPPFARRWAAAARAERGEPLDDAALFGIDPVTLVTRPMAALADEPIAVYLDLRESSLANLTPAQAAYVDLALAAERSAAARDDEARFLVHEGLDYLELGEGAGERERAQAQRLAAAIAIRSRDRAAIADAVIELEAADPLRASALAVLAAPGDLALDDARLAAWASSPPDPIELAALREADRPIAREWLREAWPACEGCGFFRRFDQLVRKLDAARTLDDAELVAALEPVVRRFEAVLTNRPLALSLRGADPNGVVAATGEGPAGPDHVDGTPVFAR